MELQPKKQEPSGHIAVDISANDKKSKDPQTAVDVSHKSSNGHSEEKVLLLASAAQNISRNQQESDEPTPAKQSTPTSLTPRTPSVHGNYLLGIDKEEEVADSSLQTLFQFKRALFRLELALTLTFTSLLVISLALDEWSKKNTIYGLPVWKVNLLILIFIGGRFASAVIVSAVFRFAEVLSSTYFKTKGEVRSLWNYTPTEKFAYIASGLKPTIQIFLWFALILAAWCLVMFPERHSHQRRRVIHRLARAWAGSLVGAALWFMKTAIMMVLAYNFSIGKSVRAIRDSVADQEALKNIWDYYTPVNEQGYMMKLERERRVETVADDFMLSKENRTWTPPKVIDAITRIQLPVIMERRRKDNTAERIAKITADELYARLAGDYSSKYIATEKVLDALNNSQKQRFPVTEEEGGVDQISRSSFRKWVTKVHLNRLLLLRSINGKDEALRELNIFASTIVLILALILWLLIMGYLTTQVMILIATQILAWNFVFNMTARTIFESIIFVFSTRPFDVGDLCSIEGSDEQMIVHRLKFLYTVFRKANGEMLVFPNISLTGKCIINFRDAPETSDSVEFTIDANTSAEKIEELKSQIEQYLSNKPKNWRAGQYSVVVDGVNRRDKSVAIYVEHVVNFYDGGDRKKRRKELIEEVNSIVSLLEIRSHSEPR